MTEPSPDDGRCVGAGFEPVALIFLRKLAPGDFFVAATYEVDDHGFTHAAGRFRWNRWPEARWGPPTRRVWPKHQIDEVELLEGVDG
jgi:hypothetical protein